MATPEPKEISPLWTSCVSPAVETTNKIRITVNLIVIACLPSIERRLIERRQHYIDQYQDQLRFETVETNTALALVRRSGPETINVLLNRPMTPIIRSLDRTGTTASFSKLPAQEISLWSGTRYRSLCLIVPRGRHVGDRHFLLCLWRFSSGLGLGLATMPLLGKDSEILLPALKCRCFLASSALKIHAEPQRPDEQTCTPRPDILRNLPTFLRRQFGEALVVGLDLYQDSGTVHV